MSIVAVVEIVLHESSAAEGLEILDRMLDDTRAFDGCEGVEVLVGLHDATRIVLVERWASLEADSVYRAFRAAEHPNPLAPHLAGAPTLVHLLQHS